MCPGQRVRPQPDESREFAGSQPMRNRSYGLHTRWISTGAVFPSEVKFFRCAAVFTGDRLIGSRFFLRQPIRSD